MPDLPEVEPLESTHISGPSSPQYADSSAGLAARFAVLRDPTHERTPADLLHNVADAARYEFGETFARGGLGRIRRAYDRRLRRFVAVKELQEPRRGDCVESRFMREALITARLEHPSIVPIHDVGTHDDGEPYYCMKLVEGRSLDEIVHSTPALADRLGLLPHVLSVADALAYAHDRQVMHRDLKPSNVLVGPFGETVIIDWGLAKDLRGAPEAAPEPDTNKTWQGSDGDQSLTQTGELLGTLPFMPLEQAQGHDIGPQADVYAVGALLYFLLSGRPPYDGGNATEIYHRLLAGPPPDIHQLVPDVSQDLAAIAHRAMARVPMDRYASARELAEDLRRFLAGRMVAARVYSPMDVLRYFVARHRTVLGTIATSLVLLLVLGIFSYVRISRENAEAERQRINAEDQRAHADENRALAERKTTEAEQEARRARDSEFAALLAAGRQKLFEQHRPADALRFFSAAYRLAPEDRAVRMLLGEATIAVDALRARVSVPAGVSVLRFDPTGRRLLIIDVDGGLHLRGVDDGSQEVAPLPPGLRISAAEFTGTAGDGLLVHTRDGVLIYFERGVERWRRPGSSDAQADLFVPEGASSAFILEPTRITMIGISDGTLLGRWRARRTSYRISPLQRAPSGGDLLFLVEGPHEEGLFIHFEVLRWDLARARGIVVNKGSKHNKHSVVASPDGRWLSLVDRASAASLHRGEHRLFDLNSNRPPVRFDRCEPIETNKLWDQDAMFTTDGGQLVRLINTKNVVRWSRETRECDKKVSLLGDEFYGLRASPDRATMAALGRNGTIAILDAETLALRRQFVVDSSRFTDVAFGHDSSILAVGDASGRVHIWTLNDPRIVRAYPKSLFAGLDADRSLVLDSRDNRLSLREVTLRGADEPPSERRIEADFSEDVRGTKEHLIFVDDHHRATIVSRATGHSICVDVPIGDWPWGFEAASDASTVVLAENTYNSKESAKDTSELISFDLRTCSRERIALKPKLYDVGLFSLRLDRGITFRPGGTLTIFSTETGGAVRTIETPDSRPFASLSPDERQLIVGESNGQVRVFDVESGALLANLREPNNAADDAIFISSRPAAFYTPDRETFFTTGPRGVLDVWDAGTFEHREELRGHTRYVDEMVFSNDSTRALSFSSDGFGDAAAFLWDLDGDGSGGRLPIQRVVRATFDPSGEILATSTAEGEVILWDTDDAAMVARFEYDAALPAGLWFSADGQLLVSTSYENTVVWRLPLETRSPLEIQALVDG